MNCEGCRRKWPWIILDTVLLFGQRHWGKPRETFQNSLPRTRKHSIWIRTWRLDVCKWWIEENWKRSYLCLFKCISRLCQLVFSFGIGYNKYRKNELGRVWNTYVETTCILFGWKIHRVDLQSVWSGRYGYQRRVEPVFCLEDGGKIFLQNVGNYLPEFTMSEPGRTQYGSGHFICLLLRGATFTVLEFVVWIVLER
jgi:hypothetical protein